MVSKYNTERKYREGQENRKEIFRFIEDYIELHGIIATEHPNTPRAYRLVGYEYRRVRG